MLFQEEMIYFFSSKMRRLYAKVLRDIIDARTILYKQMFKRKQKRKSKIIIFVAKLI